MPNKEQLKAIQSKAGPLLVLAGPGSGKTYVITHHMIYLISECHIPANQILVITFTKAAALEMQKRAVSANPACSYVIFGTFHSVFYHILKLSNPNKAYQLAGDKERFLLLKDLIKNENSHDTSVDLVQEAECCMQEISRFKNLFPDPLSQRNEKMPEKYRKIYHLYEEWLQENGKLDFDDMIKLCYQQLKSDRKLRSYWQDRFSHILIDEFQDINRLQYETICLLGANHNIYAVGDDDQAIYSFRGSDPALMNRFIRDFNAKTVSLVDNYRSSRDIVALSSRFIAHNKDRFEKHPQAVSDRTDSLKVIPCQSAKEEFMTIQEAVFQYHDQYPDKTQAILLRTNRQVYAYQNIGQGQREDTILALDLLSYLAFFNEGYKRSDFIKIMNKPVRYIPYGILSEPVIDFAKLKKRAMGKSWVVERLVELEGQVAFAKGLDMAGQARYIYKAMGYEAYYKSGVKTHPEIGTDQITDQTQDQAFELFLGRLKKCNDLSTLQKEYEAEQKTDQKNGHVTVMTYHASKGLEFDRVYLPNLEYGKVPHGRMLTLQELEEERRMFYVALTRAKESLWLLHDKSQTVSPFLEELKNTEKKR